MDDNEIQILNQVINIPTLVNNDIEEKIKKVLNKCGLFYRIFSRTKSKDSMVEKLSNPKYCDEKRVQDLIGVRIVLYFRDDVELCKNIIKKIFEVDNISEDKADQETFKPSRLNIVCRLPEEVIYYIDDRIFENYYIDKTFEIQIRTVFSEGWHEVEHDLRYKFKDEWKDEFSDLSRALNGIFATLETCDRAILDLFNQFSYKKYRKKSWESMLRNHLRIRFSKTLISSDLNQIFNNSPQVVKQIFTVNRAELLSVIAFENIGDFMLGDINNMIYIINALYLKNDDILKITPQLIKDECKEKYVEV